MSSVWSLFFSFSFFGVKDGSGCPSGPAPLPCCTRLPRRMPFAWRWSFERGRVRLYGPPAVWPMDPRRLVEAVPRVGVGVVWRRVVGGGMGHAGVDVSQGGGGQMVPLGCVQRIPRRTGAPSSPVAVYFGHDVLFGRVARGSTHRLLPVKKKSPFIPRELFRQFLPRLRIFHTLGRKCPGDGHFLFFTFLFFSRGFVGFLQPNDGPCVFLYIYFPCLFLFPQVQPAVHAARQRQQGEDV